MKISKIFQIFPFILAPIIIVFALVKDMLNQEDYFFRYSGVQMLFFAFIAVIICLLIAQGIMNKNRIAFVVALVFNMLVIAYILLLLIVIPAQTGLTGAAFVGWYWIFPPAILLLIGHTVVLFKDFKRTKV